MLVPASAFPTSVLLDFHRLLTHHTTIALILQLERTDVDDEFSLLTGSGAQKKKTEEVEAAASTGPLKLELGFRPASHHEGGERRERGDRPERGRGGPRGGARGGPRGPRSPREGEAGEGESSPVAEGGSPRGRGGRGGRGRGSGEGRGRGAPRGAPRGGAGAPRGGPRISGVNIADTNAFPSL